MSDIFISMKYIKEDLKRLIFDEKKSYVEIGKMYNVSDTNIKKVARKLGLTLEVRKSFKTSFIPHNKGENIICPECKNQFQKTFKKQQHCSQECAAIGRKTKKYQHYLDNQELYCDINVSLKFIKEHILNEQEHKCIICDNLNIWNNKEIVFILDHIDGNASNNLRDNLRLVCPNCDSQLDTYKSKNKQSARINRYK